MKTNTKIAVVGVGGFVSGILVDRIINERKSKKVVEKMDDFLDDLDSDVDKYAQEDEFLNDYKKEFNTSDTDTKDDEKKGDETDE